MSYSDIAINQPYYDDFDASKNYLNILFNPGRSVQGRELTQIQSVLQNQVSSFADHVFRDNSIVVNTNLTYVSDYSTMTVLYTGVAQTEENIIASIKSSLIIELADASSTEASVTHIISMGSDVYKLFYKSTTGGDFQATNLIRLKYNTGYTFTVNSKEQSLLVSCDSGIIYVDGKFVVVNPQSVVVDFDHSDHYHIGFEKFQSIVTSGADATLLDPSAGYSNEASPGADRYKISLELRAYTEAGANEQTVHPTAAGEASYDLLISTNLPESSDTSGEIGYDERRTGSLGEDFVNMFVEYMTIKDDRVIKSTDKVQYADLINVMARRTYDESGDYTVTDFPLTIENHESDSDQVTLNLQPGKGYVLGYEIEKEETTSLDIPKARDTLTENNGLRLAEYGQYVEIGFNDIDNTNDSSAFIVNAEWAETIEFFAASDVSFTTVLTTASVVHISKSGDNLRLYLTDILNPAAISSAGVIRSSTNTNNTANLNLVNGTATLYGDATSPIVDFGYSVTKAFTELETSYYFTKTYSYPITDDGGDGVVNIIAPTGTYYDSVLSVHTDSSGFDVADNNWITKTVGNTSIVLKRAASADWVIGESAQVVVKAQKLNFGFRTKTSTTTTERIWIDADVDVDSDKLYPATVATASVAQREANKTNTEDGIRIISVSQSNNAAAILTNDEIKTIFESAWSNGQEDYFYNSVHFQNLDLTTLKTNWIVGTTDTYYTVEYEYYEHDSNTTNKVFAPNSYPADEFDNIEVYTTANKAIRYDLANCLDLRIKKSEIGLESSPQCEFPIPGTKVQSDIEYYIPRIDKVYLTSSGDLGVAYGIASLNPELPDDIDGAMTLYVLRHQPYTYNRDGVYSVAVDNHRYTMRDIGDIEKRLEAVEEYSALTLLEKSATDLLILDQNGYDKFKSGIFVDSFMSYDTHNYDSEEYRFVIDPTTGIGHSPFTTDFFDLDVKSLNNMTVHENTITLSHPTSEVLAENNLASETVNLNPYLFFQWNGTMKLTPSIDNWIDTTQAPVIVDNRTNIRVVDETIPLPEVEANSIQARWTGIRRPSISSNVRTSTSSISSNRLPGNITLKLK